MLGFAVLGTFIAMIPGLQILWVFLIGGALASAALVPVALAVFWKRLTARGAFWGTFLSFIIGLPMSIYANFSNNPHLVVFSSVMSVGVGLAICLYDGFRNNRKIT